MTAPFTAPRRSHGLMGVSGFLVCEFEAWGLQLRASDVGFQDLGLGMGLRMCRGLVLGCGV